MRRSAKTRGWVVVLLLAVFAVRAQDVPDGSGLAGHVRIGTTLRIPAVPPPGGYTHVADLDIYLTAGNAPAPPEIAAIIARAQVKLDACRIHLRVRTINRVEAPPLLSEWESMEFNDGLSAWERALFSLTPRRSAGIVFVRRLDWTIGRDGVTAVGYGQYMEQETDYLDSERDRAFFRNHMAGHVVLGRSIGNTTLAHELGHALMGLRHARARDNVMFSGLLARDENPTFTPDQCARGRANEPWVKPVPLAERLQR